MRFLTSDRPVLSPSVSLLHRGARFTTHCPFQCHGTSHGCLGRTAITRGHTFRPAPRPRFLIRDRYRKYGQTFTQVATASTIEILKTPYHAPKANAICERFPGSVRRECLDHMLILGEGHLYRVSKEYVKYFNAARPHQGIEQRIRGNTIKEKHWEDSCIPRAKWTASQLQACGAT